MCLKNKGGHTYGDQYYIGNIILCMQNEVTQNVGIHEINARVNRARNSYKTGSKVEKVISILCSDDNFL